MEKILNQIKDLINQSISLEDEIHLLDASLDTVRIQIDTLRSKYILESKMLQQTKWSLDGKNNLILNKIHLPIVDKLKELFKVKEYFLFRLNDSINLNYRNNNLYLDFSDMDMMGSFIFDNKLETNAFDINLKIEALKQELAVYERIIHKLHAQP